jgi:hypothetical protein
MLVDGDKLAEAQAEYLRKVRRPAALVTLDLVFAQEAFRRLVGAESRVFDRKEIAAVAGVNPPVAFNWVVGGLIQPTVNRGKPKPNGGMQFSWRDAFVAATLGALARGGGDDERSEPAALRFAREARNGPGVTSRFVGSAGFCAFA